MKTNKSNAFFIDNYRAMISLGPLTESKYCPYNCAFCYVKSGFNKYPNFETNEIISYLKTNEKNTILFIYQMIPIVLLLLEQIRR